MTSIDPATETLLRAHPFLAEAPADAIGHLAARSRWIDAIPRQMIIDLNDTGTDVFLILRGMVRVLVLTLDGRRTQILGEFAAGEMFGEMAAIDDIPRSTRVEAVVRTSLIVVPAATLLDLAFASRIVGLRLMRLLTARIRAQNMKLLEHATLTMRLRLVAELLRLGRSRADGTMVVTPPPTQADLAARIGARRENVSRELAAMTRARLLHRTRSALILVEAETLRRMVDSRLG